MALVLLVGGCRFGALGRNLRTLDQNGYLRGTAALAGGDSRGPLVVVAVRADDTEGKAVDWTVLARPGPYLLVLPVGEYRIGAFADLDRSLTHDPGEPAVWAHGGGVIAVTPGALRTDIDLELPAAPPWPKMSLALPDRGSGDLDELPASRIGEVVTLADPRFSEEAAAMGLWQPVDFLIEMGAGIYFLEPYDPSRIPVLFVHGALGHPGNFRELVDTVDQRRFQTWFAYYPTAVKLDVVAAALDRWLQALEVEYDFPRLAVVAHSMGGLVARRYLAGDRAGLGGALEALTFVSIATPWQGHASAALGVERAPVVAPSWFDMAPNSAFLSALFDAPLPPYAVHDLFFAFGGSRRRSIANDGVVTVASQLEPRAQEQARRVLGFDAGHVAVLRSPLLAEELRRSLEGVMHSPAGVDPAGSTILGQGGLEDPRGSVLTGGVALDRAAED